MRRSTGTLGALAALAVGALAGCGQEPARREKPPLPHAAGLLKPGPHDVAVLEVEDFGTIRFELLPEIAPQTVENFVTLAEQGFYDGTTFHRVLPDFIVQAGCPNTRDPDPRQHGKGDAGYYIPDEFTDMKHVRGVVSMANRGSRKTASSQYFIVQRDSPQIDGQYAAFGRVTEGLDVVDAIAALEIDTYGRYGPRERPYPVQARVTSIRIERAGGEVRAGSEEDDAAGVAGAGGSAVGAEAGAGASAAEADATGAADAGAAQPGPAAPAGLEPDHESETEPEATSEPPPSSPRLGPSGVAAPPPGA